MRALTIAVAGLFLLGGAHAATTTKHLTPQQQKMAECSKENKGKKGDDYKNGVSECMKGTTTAAAPTTQQQKMTACSKENKGKKGDDYKKAMSDCLSR